MLSIIIPTRNRATQLSILLESIKNNDAIANSFEVIVIDNGSSDHTEDICSSYTGQIGNLVYAYDDEPGLLTGRHKGLTLARGEVLSFLDDDVKLNTNYIQCVIDLFKNSNNIQFATGPCLPDYEIEPPTWLNYFWNSTPEGKYCTWLSLLNFGAKQQTISPNYVWGLNFCCRKKVVIELGGFHPDCIPKNLQHFQGDGETGLIQKAIKSGMLAIYDPNLSIQHYVPKERLTIEYFKERAFYQGVCDSYAQLRSQYFNSAPLKTNKLKSLRNLVHPYYKWIKYLYIKDEGALLPLAIKELHNELNKCAEKGFQFHKENFNLNENVKEWVLKENYWDYKIPTGG